MIGIRGIRVRPLDVKSWLTWNLLWIAIYSVVFAIFFCGMPLYYDDHWYLLYLQPWFAQQGVVIPDEGGNILKYGIPWKMIFDTWQEHWLYDNFRLGNVLSVLLLLFPKWVGSGLNTVMFVWSTILCFKIAGIEIRKSPLVPLALGLLTLAVPLSNHFGSLIYQMNYIPPTWLTLILVDRIFRQQKPGNGHKKSGVVNVLLCILIGLWHEGFGVPVSAALLLDIALFKRLRRRDIIIGSCLMMICSLLLLRVPGMIGRSVYLTTLLNADIILSSLRHVLLNWGYLFTIVLAISLVAFCFKKYRKADYNAPLFIYLLECGVCIMVLNIVTNAGERMVYLPTVFAVTMLMILAKIIWGERVNRYGWISGVVCMPIYLFAMVHMIYLDDYTFKYRKMIHDVSRACARGEEYLFESVPLNVNRPVMLGKRPEHIADFTEFLCLWIKQYYRQPSTSKDGESFSLFYVILPYGFDQLDNTQGVDVSHGQGLRKYNEYLYISLDALRRVDTKGYAKHKPYGHFMLIELDYGKGYRPSHCNYYRFRSKKDGKEYVWVLPRIPWHLPYIRTLQQARLRPLDAE